MPWNEVPGKFKRGMLRSGSGHKVTSRQQMLAIMMSEREKAEAGKRKYQPKGQAMKRRKYGSRY